KAGPCTTQLKVNLKEIRQKLDRKLYSVWPALVLSVYLTQRSRFSKSAALRIWCSGA
ncbi:unnamed protein product, partial [Staurois parvus]